MLKVDPRSGGCVYALGLDCFAVQWKAFLEKD